MSETAELILKMRTAEFNRKMAQSQSKLKTFGNQAIKISNKIKVGVAVAGAGMVAFSIKAIKNFTIQEDAIIALESALRNAGDEIDNNSAKLQKFASEMQKVTVFGDELILQQMAYARNLGVTADQLDDAAIAAAGLAAKYSIDLKTAMMLIGRASKGQTQMLTRYGIALDETLSPQEKFNELLKIGAKAFQLAKDQAKTTSGALKQLSNSWGDLQEKIGSVLVDLLSFKDASGETQTVIESIAKSISKNKDDIVFSFKFIVINAKASLKQLWNLIKNTTSIIEARTFGTLKTIKKILKDLSIIAVDMGKEIWKAITFQDTDFTGLIAKHKEMVDNLSKTIVENAKKGEFSRILDGVGEIERQRVLEIEKLYADLSKKGESQQNLKPFQNLFDLFKKGKGLLDEWGDFDNLIKKAKDLASFIEGQGEKIKEKISPGAQPFSEATFAGTVEAQRAQFGMVNKDTEIANNTKKTAEETERIADATEKANRTMNQPITLKMA
jgi:hypothetical protein